MIKVILWDVDGTLLDFEKAEYDAIHACFQKFGFGDCTEEMLADYIRINRGYWERLERGELTKQEVLVGRFREFFRAKGLPETEAEAFNEAYQIALGDHIYFCRNSREILAYCKGRVKQYVVTNGTKTAQDRKLSKSGILSFFDGIFISDVVGYEKPSTAFFNEVFRSIGSYDRSEVMIVGDSLTSDILGGNRAGIVSCWYNPGRKENTTAAKADYEITDLLQVAELLESL